MCVVSMIGDHYRQTIPERFPDWTQLEPKGPTRSEFDALKKMVEEMKQLLDKAIEYDKNNKEPNCQTDEKLELLRRIAEKVGINLNA